MIRVCPKRDAVCQHGMDCPYSIDRYQCEEEPQKRKPAIMTDKTRERIARIIDTAAILDNPKHWQIIARRNRAYRAADRLIAAGFTFKEKQ